MANILTVERGKEIQTGHLLKLLPVFETVCPNRGRLKNISMLSHRAFEFSYLMFRVISISWVADSYAKKLRMEWQMDLNRERITNKDRDQPVTVFIAKGSNHISYCKKTEYFDRRSLSKFLLEMQHFLFNFFSTFVTRAMIP